MVNLSQTGGAESVGVQEFGLDDIPFISQIGFRILTDTHAVRCGMAPGGTFRASPAAERIHLRKHPVVHCQPDWRQQWQGHSCCYAVPAVPQGSL